MIVLAEASVNQHLESALADATGITLHLSAQVMSNERSHVPGFYDRLFPIVLICR